MRRPQLDTCLSVKPANGLLQRITRSMQWGKVRVVRTHYTWKNLVVRDALRMQRSVVGLNVGGDSIDGLEKECRDSPNWLATG